MTPTQEASSQAEVVFRPKDPTRTAVVAVAVTAAIVFWIASDDILGGDPVIIAALGGFVALIAAIVIPLARRAAKRTIAVSGQTLRIAGGETIDLSAVQALEKRKVRTGKHSYIGYFAIQAAGRETMLFADAAFPEQAVLIQLIEAQIGCSVQDRT